MTRVRPPERLGDVALAELGMTTEDVATAGLEVLEMWDGAPGVSRSDAWRVNKERTTAGEEAMAASQKMFTDQNEWMQDRSSRVPGDVHEGAGRQA